MNESGQHTPALLSLDDSYARLRWAEKLIAQIAPACEVLDAGGETVVELRECKSDPGYVHARYVTDGALDVPADLGFVLADIAVNLRSCLDMAIQEVATAHRVRVWKPQFPIEEEPGKVDKTMARFPAPFQMALRTLQPSYDIGFGHFDIPVNSTALMIKEVANANKHRNVTPVVRNTVAWARRPGGGSSQVEDIPADRSAWSELPPDSSLREIRLPRALATMEVIARFQPFESRKLQLMKSELRYRDTPFPIDVPVTDFLRDGPKYVRLALRVISQADAYARNPVGQFRPARDLTL